MDSLAHAYGKCDLDHEALAFLGDESPDFKAKDYKKNLQGIEKEFKGCIAESQTLMPKNYTDMPYQPMSKLINQ